jgi:transcriptional regulator with XRE-family HTH domain
MKITIFRFARLLTGSSQKQIAKKARLGGSTLSQIENGWLIPKPHQLKRLKRVLPQIERIERGEIKMPDGD